MQLNFDSAAIAPNSSKGLEEKTFGLLTVKQRSKQVEVMNHITITLWECVCNCLRQPERASRGKKVTSHHHLVKGHTWCCDNCKGYFKTPEGKAILADAKYRMKWFKSTFDEALVEATGYSIHCQIEAGTY
jgi:hypothetical protein